MLRQQFAVDKYLIILELNRFARQADDTFDVIYLVFDEAAFAVRRRIDRITRILEDYNIAPFDLTLRQEWQAAASALIIRTRYV